jgi:hypothetical protein
MNTWFECNAKYVKIDENGREKKVSESYLLDAMSFTEAESKIYKELETMVSGEFNVTKIAKTNIAEIIPSEDGEKWFKAKVAYISMDEESGKEKRTSQYVLVLAKTVKDAFDKIEKNMEGMMVDFEISAISESTIMDVFPYSAEEVIPDNLTPVAEYNEEKSEEVIEETVEEVNDSSETEYSDAPDLEEIEETE